MQYGRGRLAGEVARQLLVSHLVEWAPPVANIKVLYLVPNETSMCFVYCN